MFTLEELECIKDSLGLSNNNKMVAGILSKIDHEKKVFDRQSFYYKNKAFFDEIISILKGAGIKEENYSEFIRLSIKFYKAKSKLEQMVFNKKDVTLEEFDNVLLDIQKISIAINNIMTGVITVNKELYNVITANN